MLKFITALVVVTTTMLSCMRAPVRNGGNSLITPPSQNQGGSAAPDCSAATLPQGSNRVYIALREGKDGSGSSVADARDGTTQVVGVHDLGPGNKNAPVRGRCSSFAFGHALRLLRAGLTGPALTATAV